MAKTFFVADTSRIDPDQDAGCGDWLVDALRIEFPAFYVSEWIACDGVAAFVVETIVPNVPEHAMRRLDGWGHGPLTLRMVK